MTKGDTDSGEELRSGERRGYVVVGPLVQRLDLAGFGPLGGEHDYRYFGPAAQLSADLDAVDIGQAEVEDDHRRGAGRDLGQCLGTRRGDRHAKVPGVQCGRESPDDPGLVVDHEDELTLGRHLASAR